MPANEMIPGPKSGDKAVYDSESPIDFCEMMAVAWIRLIASVAHGFVLLLTPRPEQARSEQGRFTKAGGKGDEDELLLHVLE